MTNQPSNIIIYNTVNGKASVALYALDERNKRTKFIEIWHNGEK